MAYSGQDFNDVQMVYGSEGETDWRVQKPKLIEGGLQFANLPYILDGDNKIAETLACHNYLAAKFKPALLGTTPQEQADCTMISLILHPLNFNKVTIPCYQTDDRAKIIAESKDGIASIAKWLGEKTYLCGNNITWVDFYCWEFINRCEWMYEGKFFTEFPVFEAYRNRISNLPGVKEFVASAKPLPWNNVMAKINAEL